MVVKYKRSDNLKIEVLMKVMDAWKCYACQQLAQEERFLKGKDHLCPKCGSEDVFPHREYKAEVCGCVVDQNTLFPEAELDQDPGETISVEGACPACGETTVGEGNAEILIFKRIPTEVA